MAKQKDQGRPPHRASSSRYDATDRSERGDDSADGGERGPRETHGSQKPRPRDKDGEARRKRLLHEWRKLAQHTWTPWLLMRYGLSDLGYRPVPSGEGHWRCPDIYIESSDANGNGVAGEDNFVHARIFNLGKADSVPTRVDFYWADPSIGLGASSMNHIGTEWVEVPHHRVVDVRCNTAWVPVFVNDGHECLKVNCSNALLDPIQHPFEPRLDRHVGQRNVTVLEAQAGETQALRLKVSNLFPRSMKSKIVARIEHVAVDAVQAKSLPHRDIVNQVMEVGGLPNDGAALMSRYLPGTDAHRRVMRASSWLENRRETRKAIAHSVKSSGARARNLPCIGAQWDRHRCVVQRDDGDAAVAALQESLAALADRRPDAAIEVTTAELGAYEQRNIELELGVPTSARAGEFIVFHVSQRTQGITLGGYTVVVKVVGG